MNPRDNIFNVDPKEETSQQAVTAWMTKDSMVGLMKHSVHMSSGKAGKSKAKKAASGSMALGEVRRTRGTRGARSDELGMR